MRIWRMLNQRSPYKLKAWRMASKLSLKKLAAALAERGYEVSDATLSRVENGEQIYTQPLLEALAAFYGTDVGSLLLDEPHERSNIMRLFRRVPADKKRDAERILKALGDVEDKEAL